MSFDAGSLRELNIGLDQGKIFRPFDTILKVLHCYWEVHNFTYFDIETSKLVLYRYRPRDIDGISEFLANITMQFNRELDGTVYFEAWPDGSGPVFYSKLIDAVTYCENHAVNIIKNEMTMKDRKDQYLAIWTKSLDAIGFKYIPDSE